MKRIRIIACSGLMIFIILCSCISALAEWYILKCYPIIAAVLSFFSRLTSYSLLDFLIFLAVIALLISIVLMFTKRLSFRRWIKKFMLSVIWIVIWFYMAWGIGYFRPDFFERFDVEPPKEDREYFEQLVVRNIKLLNSAYIENPKFDIKEINSEIERLYEKRHIQLHLPYPCGWERTKKTIFEPLMTRMGVEGYFGPFFNEVHVNNFSLPVSYPFVLAHEKAHRFGIVSEAECNLYAAVICTSSEYEPVRYSGYLQTVWYLLRNLNKISPNNYQTIVQQIDPRILQDYQAIRSHWQKGVNPTLSAAQSKVYDAYLKANKQSSGILSYSEMTNLLVAWEQIAPPCE